jgi:SynChlorMet cassette protein ScmC
MRNKYTLTLADGSNWQFESENELESWLDQLAQVMCLKKGEFKTANAFYFFSAVENSDTLPQSTQLQAQLNEGKWDYYLGGQPIKLWINHQENKSIIGIYEQYLQNHALFYLYMSSSIIPLFFHSLETGGMPIHAALTCFKEKGILISATGDTGKTTCCQRLPKDGKWRYLCDDLSLLIRSQDDFFAHPLPTWSDYMIRKQNTAWDVGKHIPVKAIFFLEQGEKDEVIPISATETSVRLLRAVKQGWFWDMEEEPAQKQSRNFKIYNNTKTIAEGVPCFILRATLTGEFWKSIEEVI